MDMKTFHLIAGVIFAIVTLVNLTRIYMGWPVVIGSCNVPMWASYIALLVAGTMSYFAFTLADTKTRKRKR